MNIVYVHQHFSTRRGFTGTRSYDFARGLMARGHRVTVVTGVCAVSDLSEMALEGGVTRREVDGIDVRIVNVRYDNKQGFARRILAFLRFMLLATREVLSIRDADVVLATSTPLTVGFPGTMAHWVRGKPFVFEVRDLWPESVVKLGILRNPVLIWLAERAEHTFYRAADRIVAISHRMAEHLVRQHPQHAAKVTVIPLGTDVAAFRAAAPDLEWRRAHGLEGKCVAVYAGAHGRINALPAVLEAAGRLRDDPQIRIVLIGDGVLKPQLLEQARREGLSNVLLLDSIPKERLAGVLKACDLGLMTLDNFPTVDVACPNKFMDYLAAGLPVLVNFDGEAGWICRDQRCGVVVPPEDSAAMAEAIRGVAHDAQGRREMGERAAALAAARFDRARLIEDLERVLTEACGGAAPVGGSGPAREGGAP